MHKRLVALGAIVILAILAGQAVRTAGKYVKAGEIAIGGAGTFDYLAVDPAAKRLYVTHGTEIVVIDTATSTVVGRIADTPRVHGIAIGANGRAFTSNGGENKVGIVDLKTLTTLSKVDTGQNPDAVLYVPSRKEVYAFNHTGESATVIAAETGTATATIKLGGQAESSCVCSRTPCSTHVLGAACASRSRRRRTPCSYGLRTRVTAFLWLTARGSSNDLCDWNPAQREPALACRWRAGLPSSHGGSVTLESGGPGGSCFTVRLPRG